MTEQQQQCYSVSSGAMYNNWPPEELLTVAALSQLAQLDMQLAVSLGASWLAR